jgi:hypothetical protein
MGAQDKHRARRQRRQAHRALEQVDARKQLLLHALVLSRHVGGHVKDLLLLARKVVVVLQHPLAKLLLSRHRVRHLLLAPHQLLLERFDPQRRALQQPRIVELGRALASLCQTGSTCKTARWARGGPTTLQATPGLRGCPHGAPAFFSLPLPLPFFGAMPASAAGGWGRRGSSTAWPVRKIGRSLKPRSHMLLGRAVVSFSGHLGAEGKRNWLPFSPPPSELVRPTHQPRMATLSLGMVVLPQVDGVAVAALHLDHGAACARDLSDPRSRGGAVFASAVVPSIDRAEVSSVPSIINLQHRNVPVSVPVPMSYEIW